MCLPGIVAFTVHGERERLQACGGLAFVQEELVQTEQNRAAVDPSGERNSNRRRSILRRDPAAQLAVNGFDVTAAGEIQVFGQLRARRVEEAAVHGIGIGTSDQTQSRNVVRGHHSRVRRMELTFPPVARELCGDLVDALSHYQHRSIGGLRQEIPQGTVETSRQRDPVTFLRD